MTTVRIFLGSVDALAPCPGATGAGDTTRGAARLPGSLSATGSSCFDTIRSLSAFAKRSCATLLDCGSPALAGTIFEEHPPFTNNPGAAAFIKVFNERAAKAGLTDTSVDTQAAASYTAWQVLEAAVTATKSLDDKVLADWLRTHKVDTIQGRIRFDGPSNYGDDLMRVKQVQNGKWVVVWPKDAAAPGAKLIVR